MKEVYVSDESIEDALERKNKRKLLHANPDGSCICLLITANSTNDNISPAHIIFRPYYAEIPEVKKRYMTKLEVLSFTVNTLYKGYVVRVKECDWRSPLGCAFGLDVESYEYAKIKDGVIGKPMKFMIEEE